MLLAVWRVVSLLTIGGAGADEDQARMPLRPGYRYTIKRVTATADESFCMSVIEQCIPHRALAIGCYGGGKRAEFTFRERAQPGAVGKFYTVVVFSREPVSQPPIAVVVTTEIDKEKAP